MRRGRQRLTGHNSSIEKVTEKQGLFAERENYLWPDVSTAGIGNSLPYLMTPSRISRRMASITSGFWARIKAAVRTEPLYMMSKNASGNGNRQICGICLTEICAKPAADKTRFDSSGSLNRKNGGPGGM